MNTRLIAVALVSATAALSSPAFAQDAPVYGTQTDGSSTPAPAHHRASSFRGSYNQAPAGVGNQEQLAPEVYNGWVSEGAVDHSRPGGLDPDFRPAN